MTWNYFNTLMLNHPAAVAMLLLVNTGAVYRVSRLIARDTLLEKPRNAITSRYHGMIPNLLLCIWCLSFWFAIVAVVLTCWDDVRNTWLVIASMLTIATAVGYLGERA